MQRTVMKSKRRIEVDSPTYWYGKVKRDVSNRRRTNARGPQVNDKKHLPIPSPLSDDALAGSSTHNPFAAIMVVSWCFGVVVRRSFMLLFLFMLLFGRRGANFLKFI